jgi:putative SOS response-associated peptidase YedK
MCNLYRMRRTTSEVGRLFGASMPSGLNLPPEVYPGYPGLVIRQQDGQRVGQVMNWGFPLRLKSMKPTSKPKPVNNARDDKLMTPFWRHWFETPAQRCLIPFTEFAEAVGPKGKMTRTWIGVTDPEVPAWAGLWRPSDEWGDVYTGVMVYATEELFHIHDRMPVIIPTDAQDI